jgi:flavin reductase (DIM6/NTAB) family NADH-FMN oxidoreductase RutF
MGMEKNKMGPGALLFPMPAVLVGGRAKDGRVNFTTIAWAGVVNSMPPMIGAGIRKSRFIHELIMESGVFSVNIPSHEQAAEVDYCGCVSGRKQDKASRCGFTVFYGGLENAPLIEECPMNITCRVEKIVELPSHDYFIGAVAEIYRNADPASGPGDEMEKISPLVFMGTHYSRVQGNLGKAFSVGKNV